MVPYNIFFSKKNKRKIYVMERLYVDRVRSVVEYVLNKFF